ncbi:MAG: hypothetical protein ACK55Z_12435, partial [bacterium]
YIPANNSKLTTGFYSCSFILTSTCSFNPIFWSKPKYFVPIIIHTTTELIDQLESKLSKLKLFDP